jgi:hypothetical protein
MHIRVYAEASTPKHGTEALPDGRSTNSVSVLFNTTIRNQLLFQSLIAMIP